MKQYNTLRLHGKRYGCIDIYVTHCIATCTGNYNTYDLLLVMVTLYNKIVTIAMFCHW